jgi:hypothetical protein
MDFGLFCVNNPGTVDPIVKAAGNSHDRRLAGNPYSNVVLVGDRSNPNTRRDVWPFFDYGYSSLWLTRALSQLGIMEKNLCWINLFDEEGKLQWTDEELASLEHKRLIAMGANAQHGLMEVGLPHAKVPHPQWFSRFQNHNGIERLHTLFNELGVPSYDQADYRSKFGLV